MSSLLRHPGAIIWRQDLNGSTATTPYPSLATDGVAIDAGANNAPSPQESGARVHVKLRYQVASGTVSTDIHVYGYTPDTVAWYYLGSMNGGASLVSTVPAYAVDGSTVAKAEYFVASGENYTRFATRCIAPAGTTPLVSTWIGWEI